MSDQWTELEEAATKATPGPYDVHAGCSVRSILGDLAEVIARMEIPWGLHRTATGRRSFKQDCAATAAEVHNARYFAACDPATILSLISAARGKQTPENELPFGCMWAAVCENCGRDPAKAYKCGYKVCPLRQEPKP